MMILIDASPHEWIIDGERFTLHGAIDDATGEVLALFFAKNECLDAYFEVLWQILVNYGIPLSVYVDKHTIFLSPKFGKLSVEDELAGKRVNDTQFGRALKELGITLIPANSPQTKGRIERLWGTLQSRLPVEFKLAGIKSIEAANAFLQKFMEVYNQKFAVSPANRESAFRELPKAVNLDHILCLKEFRKGDNSSGFSYGGEYYQLIRNGKVASIIPKANIVVLQALRLE
jgi:transposase InsO family protein